MGHDKASEMIGRREERRRHEVSATIAMLNSTAYWERQITDATNRLREELESMRNELDDWRTVANQFATAEHPHEKVMAFESWEIVYTKYNKGEQQQ